MKNYGDLGGCYPPRPTASTDNTLLDLHNSSEDTQPHSLIVKYTQSGVHASLSFTVHFKISSGCGAVNCLSVRSS